MPSPFPGMDPFIETSGRWQGFHTSFLTACRAFLLSQLPANYDADIEERVQLVDQGDLSSQSFRPDVSIRRTAGLRSSEPASLAVAEYEPVILNSPKFETESVGFIEIRTLPDSHLVTVIEILSPTNKVEPDRSNYLAKMEQFRQAGVHLVEIDLLLAGKRLPMAEPLPAGDYYGFIRRRENYPKCEVHHWSIRSKLPMIPVPLKLPDPDVALDLDVVFRETFDRGGYSRRVRYDEKLSGNLSDADRDWVKAIVINRK